MIDVVLLFLFLRRCQPDNHYPVTVLFLVDEDQKIVTCTRVNNNVQLYDVESLSLLRKFSSGHGGTSGVNFLLPFTATSKQQQQKKKKKTVEGGISYLVTASASERFVNVWQVPPSGRSKRRNQQHEGGGEVSAAVYSLSVSEEVVHVSVLTVVDDDDDKNAEGGGGGRALFAVVTLAGELKIFLSLTAIDG
jgi:hypothetical protein